MKRLSSICLLFILIAAAIIICFWFGFSFGQESQRQKDLVQLTEARLEAENATNHILNRQEQESVQTNTEHATPQFYLKKTGEYISVYVSATDEVYFETDIAILDLPVQLQEEMEEGMDFYNLESVYMFLENYSS